jgi:hypothetical protein
MNKPNINRIDPRLQKFVDPKLLEDFAESEGKDTDSALNMMGVETPENYVELPQTPQQFPYDEMDAGAQAEALSMPQEAPVKPNTGLQDPGLRAASDALDKGMVGLKEVPPPSSPVSEDDDLKRLREAQERDQNQAMMLGLLRGANQIGAGLAMTKADQSGVEALEKQIGTREKNVKSQIASKDDLQKIKRARLELEDENAMRDPNSEISKLVSGLASKTGLIQPGKEISAMSLKNTGVNLGVLLSTIEAGKSREAAAALAREARSQSASERRSLKSEEDELKRMDKRKIVTEEIEERKRNIASNIERAKQLVESGGTFELTGPQSEQLNAIIDEIAVDTAKLQDPNSVARPSEVQLVRNNLIPSDMVGKLGMRNKTALSILDSFNKRIDERAAVGYKVRGVTPQVNEENKGSQYSPKEEMGIQTVMDRNGVSREQAISALKKAGKLK